MSDVLMDVPYVSDVLPDPLRQFDFYFPKQRISNLKVDSHSIICFVHGGAWRSEDKKDHESLARNLVLMTGIPVAVPNYRFSTGEGAIRHPVHAEDILQFLNFLLTWEGSYGFRWNYNPSRLFLMGHSCSAHMLASIFLDSTSISPSLAPPPPLLQATTGIIMSEGIYDLDKLLSRFPEYRDWFIVDAFGQRDSYASLSVTTFPLHNPDIHWLVLHSSGDELVDISQSQGMVQHLQKLLEPSQVTHHFDKLKGGHNEILRTDIFVEMVRDFVVSLLND